MERWAYGGPFEAGGRARLPLTTAQRWNVLRPWPTHSSQYFLSERKGASANINPCMYASARPK